MEIFDNYIVINGKRFIPYISQKEIDEIISNLSIKITKDYRDKNPLFLIVLKGSIFTAADLLRKLNFPCEIGTISAKSYGSLMESSGNVEISNFKLNIKSRHVVIIEDIVDTGKTLSAMLSYLSALRPASLEALALLSKPGMRKVDVNVKFIGKDIPSLFVVGYGLDYDEMGRNLPGVYILDEETVPTI